MLSAYYRMIISLAVGAIISSVKNPKKKAELRTVLLEVFLAIKGAYAGDPDFS